MSITTTTSGAAWSPDQVSSYSPTDLIPTAAILSLASFGGTVDGDRPSLLVPFISDDGDATVVAEAGDIAQDDPALDEVEIHTTKVARLTKVSNEQTAQPAGAQAIADALARSIVSKADGLFLAGPADPGPTGLTGLITTTAGTIGATSGLWAVFDAIASLEAEGGKGTHLVVHPSDFAVLAKLPDEEGSARPVLGAIGSTTGRQIAGLPVVVSRFAEAGKALVIDRSEIVAAYGQVQIARSDDYYFGADSVALRATWRLGWAVPRPTRAGRVLTLDEPAGA